LKKDFRVAVIGGHSVNEEIYNLAYKFGELVAKNNWIIVNGGLTGVMEAVSKGAAENNGIVIGILPGDDFNKGNPYLSFGIATNLSWMRNSLVVLNADVIVAIDGSYGTLSEISYSIIMGKKVFGLGSWDIKGVEPVQDLESLIEKIKDFQDNAQL